MLVRSKIVKHNSFTIAIWFAIHVFHSQSQFTATEANELKQEEKFLQAVDLITESAEQGHPEALVSLGQLYELADNYKVALQW
jgi:TPR repeat protein